jgi:hypothetical protein
MADDSAPHPKPARTYSAFPAFDPERYRAASEELDLEAEECAALLRALWDIAVILYDIGATEITIPDILGCLIESASSEPVDSSDSEEKSEGGTA